MKKLFTVLFAVLMCFSLAACSGSDTAEETKETIVIGGSGPTSGPAALYGTAVERGAQIAVDEINEKEGKEFFKLDFQDDEHDAEKAVNAFGTLVDGGMQVSLLCTTSSPCKAVAPLTQEADIFAITPSGSEATIPTFGENIFQMCFTDPNQGIASADYIFAHFADKKVGVIYQSSIDYSNGIYQKFMEEADKIGLEISAETSFTDEADYSVQIEAVKDCDVVFLPIYYTEAAGVLTQAGDFKPVWFGVDGMDGILGVQGFDTALAEGVYLLTPFVADAKDEATQKFVAKYQELYNETPIQFAADAYDCVFAIYDACKAGNVTASMSASEISAILRDQFTSMKFNGLTGSDVTWAASGEVSKAPLAMIIENGVYVSAD